MKAVITALPCRFAAFLIPDPSSRQEGEESKTQQKGRRRGGRLGAASRSGAWPAAWLRRCSEWCCRWHFSEWAAGSTSPPSSRAELGRRAQHPSPAACGHVHPTVHGALWGQGQTRQPGFPRCPWCGRGGGQPRRCRLLRDLSLLCWDGHHEGRHTHTHTGPALLSQVNPAPGVRVRPRSPLGPASLGHDLLDQWGVGGVPSPSGLPLDGPHCLPPGPALRAQVWGSRASRPISRCPRAAKGLPSTSLVHFAPLRVTFCPLSTPIPPVL